MFRRSGNLIVILGPSGVGKSTLVGRVRAAMPELEFSISCTTRSPRAGEMDGREYYFLSPEEFEKRSAAGEFLEQAEVFEHRYGTLKAHTLECIRSGRQMVLDIDVQGALQIRRAAEQDPEIKGAAHFILIAPPSLAALEKRLRGRDSETDEQLELRLAGARNELSFFRSYDYMLVNDEIESAAAKLSCLLRSFRLLTANIKGDPFQ